jgi:hypothetical protein
MPPKRKTSSTPPAKISDVDHRLLNELIGQVRVEIYTLADSMAVSQRKLRYLELLVDAVPREPPTMPVYPPGTK